MVRRRYRVDGPGGWESGYRWDPSRVLLDPYAKHVAGRRQWATRHEFEKFEQQVSGAATPTFLPPSR